MIENKMVLLDDVTESRMEVFLNDNNKIAIVIGNDLREWYNCEIISLDKKDIEALIKQLNKLKKQL